MAADDETLTTTGDGLRGVASTGLATNVTTPAGDIGPPPGRDDLAGLAEVDARSYVFGAAIARGGMGIIRSARDRRLGREVAIKELLVRTPSLIRRFEREARITARLEHPGIVSVHEAGRWRNGEPFFAMRKVAGIPLDQAVERCHSVEERLPLVAHVLAAADALAYAHSLRVIHRDLKPANVLVGSFGETVVIDWGLAKELDRDEGTPAPPESAEPPDESGEPDGADLADLAPAAGATAIGTVLGTPSYMAPEQARAEAVDERADVHALGAMLYHVLAGRRPYDGSAHAEILAAVLDGPPPPLASRQPGLPRELVAIVERAMAYAPADRYPRAQEMADDLRRYQAGQLVGAHRYTAGELVRRWIRRHRAAVAVAALAAVALITVGVVSLRQVVAEKRAAEAQRRAAEATASALLVEQGRQEYLAGRPGRALVYLSAAYQRGQRDVAVRTLLNRALPSVEAQERVVEAHAGTVSSAAFSPDGERVVTAGTDGKACIWSRDGRLLASLAHHGGAVVAALSPDGARLATASSSGEVRLWDARSGALLRELAGHTAPISMIDWSGDGSRFATSSHDGTTRVWDPESGVATMVLGSGKSMATSVHFVPGRPRLVTGDRDGVHLWDLATGREVAPLPYSLGQPIVSPDGRLMATVSVDRMIETFDTETGAARARWQVGNWSDEAKRALFTTSGYLVTFGEGAGATLWRPDGMLASDMVGHSAQIVAMAASRDGNLLATGSLDRTARIWIVGRRDPVAVLDGHGGSVRAVAFSPDGSRLVTGADDGTLRFWRVPATGGSRGQPTRPVGDRVVLDATGSLMAACTGNRLVVREVATGVERASIPGNPWMLRFSPDGRWLAAADKLGAVRLLDTATWSVARTLETGSQQIYELAFAPAGDRLLVIRPGVPSEIWDTETGTRRVTLAGGGAGYDADQVADFSPDGKQVATIDARGLITLWDAATGQAQHRLRGHTDAGAALIYSADGRRLVSGGLDTTARVWDLSNGALISVLQGGHTRSVNVIRLSPDGALAVTGGTDRIILLWDIETGRLLSQLQLSASMFDGHFGADGALITADNHIWTWDLRPEARSPEVIAAIVAARVPWRLRDGRLVSVTVPEAR